ncbi:NUMOD4 [Hexamita inflata]|uniref:NUMOD4 n=1 Tax=Hexamita inflata TaxID=28002 RepID=A0AA86Q889_9EUKA|nr:NUMOD4 [Hexamita inflata]
MNQQSEYEESIYNEEISQEEIIEEYRDISGYPNYEVSNFGQVRNKTTGRIQNNVIDVMVIQQLISIKIKLGKHIIFISQSQKLSQKILIITQRQTIAIVLSLIIMFGI